MDNNDILRRLRFALRLDDPKVAALCASVGHAVTTDQVRTWLAAEPSPCDDADLGAFLDGLILDRRGPHDGPAPPARPLDNNEILKKLRIALAFKVDDVVAAIQAGGQPLSSTEISALFRSPAHKHYLPAGNQVLRAFLAGVTLKLRPDSQPRTPKKPPRTGGDRPARRPKPAPSPKKKANTPRRRLALDVGED